MTLCPCAYSGAVSFGICAKGQDGNEILHKQEPRRAFIPYFPYLSSD